MKSILDRSFRYTPAAKTNLHKTFARIRREQQKAEATPPDEPTPPTAQACWPAMKVVK
jgi:hypothetical protein